jgi:hypothetical protein
MIRRIEQRITYEPDENAEAWTGQMMPTEADRYAAAGVFPTAEENAAELDRRDKQGVLKECPYLSDDDLSRVFDRKPYCGTGQITPATYVVWKWLYEASAANDGEPMLAQPKRIGESCGLKRGVVGASISRLDQAMLIDAERRGSVAVRTILNVSKPPDEFREPVWLSIRRRVHRWLWDWWQSRGKRPGVVVGRELERSFNLLPGKVSTAFLALRKQKKLRYDSDMTGCFVRYVAKPEDE